MFVLQFTMWVYTKMFVVAEDKVEEEEKNVEVIGKKEDDKKSKPKAGILEGIHLFMKHNYVKGIFAISCLFMVEVTIVVSVVHVICVTSFFICFLTRN